MLFNKGDERIMTTMTLQLPIIAMRREDITSYHREVTLISIIRNIIRCLEIYQRYCSNHRNLVLLVVLICHLSLNPLVLFGLHHVFKKVMSTIQSNIQNYFNRRRIIFVYSQKIQNFWLASRGLWMLLDMGLYGCCVLLVPNTRIVSKRRILI